ncbi:MAG: hypothetical protein J1F64_09380 [Oscillospiraceae bacterium]|nr:hypothetical protein [Oscillospiraceae bacterium]
MNSKKDTGVFQLENGCWGYRYRVNINDTFKESRRITDDFGKPFKTKASAIKAREQAIMNERINAAVSPQSKLIRKTVEQVYDEYKEFGRAGKAYATIKKQDSLTKIEYL